MRVKRGLRKTRFVCKLKGCQRGVTLLIRREEMTTLGTVLFKFDLIMCTEIWSVAVSVH